MLCKVEFLRENPDMAIFPKQKFYAKYENQIKIDFKYYLKRFFELCHMTVLCHFKSTLMEKIARIYLVLVVYFS